MTQLLIVVTGEPTPSVAAMHGDFTRILERAFGKSLGSTAVVDARREALHGAARGADAIVITGSAAHVHEREPWVVATEHWVASEAQAGRPMLGLCFGHQLLASALGGEVLTNPAGREMGTVALERLTDDPLFAGLPTHFAVNTCHLDTVTSLPHGALVLARSVLDAHQAVRFGERCYGVQFHPEFDGAVMRGYVEAKRDALLAEGRDPARMLDDARDTPEASGILRNFLTLIA